MNQMKKEIDWEDLRDVGSDWLKGESWFKGWDIPTKWAIDPSGTCYMNDAHGGMLKECTRSELLMELAGNDDLAEGGVRKRLGMKPALPEWMAEALAAGWLPPAGWDRAAYDD